MERQAHTVPARHSGNPLWEAHRERLRELYGGRRSATAQRRPRGASIGAREADEARQAEWTARPPGRLGRRLLAEIEPYLEFFAIARPG
jgi:hypothetical protein